MHNVEKCLYLGLSLFSLYKNFIKLLPCWNMEIGTSWICVLRLWSLIFDSRINSLVSVFTPIPVPPASFQASSVSLMANWEIWVAEERHVDFEHGVFIFTRRDVQTHGCLPCSLHLTPNRVTSCKQGFTSTGCQKGWTCSLSQSRGSSLFRPGCWMSYQSVLPSWLPE